MIPYQPKQTHLRVTNAKLAFAGDEGARIQMAIEGGVYAEEERWNVARVLERLELRAGSRHPKKKLELLVTEKMCRSGWKNKPGT